MSGANARIEIDALEWMRAPGKMDNLSGCHEFTSTDTRLPWFSSINGGHQRIPTESQSMKSNRKSEYL